MVSTNSLKNGMTLNLDGELWRVEYFQHVKPGKGGAFVRTTLKGVRSGKTVDRTFRAGENVDQAILTRRQLQYLYREGEQLVFMDTEHFEQTYVSEEAIGDAASPRHRADEHPLELSPAIAVAPDGNRAHARRPHIGQEQRCVLGAVAIGQAHSHVVRSRLNKPRHREQRPQNSSANGKALEEPEHQKALGDETGGKGIDAKESR